MDLRFLVRSSFLFVLAATAVACVSPAGSLEKVAKKPSGVCFSDEVDCSTTGGLKGPDGAARAVDADEDCDESSDECDDE